jgi:hypothetical protein
MTMAACWAPRRPKGSACTEPGQSLAPATHQSRPLGNLQLKAPARFTARGASGASRSHPIGHPSIDTGGEPCAQALQPAHRRGTYPRTPSQHTRRERTLFSKRLKSCSREGSPALWGATIPPTGCGWLERFAGMGNAASRVCSRCARGARPRKL